MVIADAAAPVVGLGAGVLFLVGRLAYWRGYVQHPERRMVGNILTMVPIGLLLLATLAGLGRSAFA